MATHHNPQAGPSGPQPVIVQVGRPTEAEMTGPQPYKRPWGHMKDPVAQLAAEEAMEQPRAPLVLIEPLPPTPLPEDENEMKPPRRQSLPDAMIKPLRHRHTNSDELALRMRSETFPGPQTASPRPLSQSFTPAFSAGGSPNNPIKTPIHLTPKPITPYPHSGTAACYETLISCPFFAFDKDGYIIHSSLTEKMISLYNASRPHHPDPPSPQPHTPILSSPLRPQTSPTSTPSTPPQTPSRRLRTANFSIPASPTKLVSILKKSVSGTRVNRHGVLFSPTSRGRAGSVVLSPAQERRLHYWETCVVLDDVRTGCGLAVRAARELKGEKEREVC